MQSDSQNNDQTKKQTPVQPTQSKSDLDHNRNTSNAEPIEKEELSENLSAAEGSIEKPEDQEA